MSRIAETFERAAEHQRLAVAPYVTVGYPDLNQSIALARAYADVGADMLELGVPFSDPIADGPTIQRASQRALENGVTVARCLEAIAEIRRSTDAALLLMGYANPFMQYGFDRLSNDLLSAGGDGLIVPDLLPELAGDLQAPARARGLDLVHLVAPTTTSARMTDVLTEASGFVYCVSVTGVTGSRDRLDDSLMDYLQRVRTATQLPRAVGFGISRPEHVRSLHGVAEGAIAASALIDTMDAAAPAQAVAAAAAHLETLVEAAQCA